MSTAPDWMSGSAQPPKKRRPLRTLLIIVSLIVLFFIAMDILGRHT